MEKQKKSLRILFITLYFPPEPGAAQNRIFDLAVRLKKRNHKVTVLTGFPSYPLGKIPVEYRGKWCKLENIDDINIVRSWIFPVSNERLYWRLINHISFVFSGLINASRCGAADVVYVESPPLFIGVLGRFIAKIKKAPYLFNVADLWPDFAVELGLVKENLLLAAAYRIESYCYKNAEKIAGVTEGVMDRLLNEKNNPSGKLVHLRNGVDIALFRPGVLKNEIHRKLNLHNKFVAGYIGNHGHWQGLEVLLEAAHLLNDNPEYHFIFVGDGARKKFLDRYAGEKKLINVTFIPIQDRLDIPGYWAIVDCALIPLRNVFCSEQALPVKLFEAMAMEVPVILGIKGEARTLLKNADAGIAVEPENPVAVADAIIKLSKDSDIRKKLGTNGRKYVVKYHNRDKLADEVEAVLLNMDEEN